MGRSTNSDIAENVAVIGDIESISSIFNDDFDDETTIVVNGWKVSQWQDGEIMSGRKKWLYADSASKGDKHISLINSSEYSNVGEYDFVVFSNDRSAVEVFLKDFDIDVSIADIDSVCQTL